MQDFPFLDSLVFFELIQGALSAGEIIRNESHSHSAFSYCGRDPVHRPRADVAGREDTGDAGFERQGLPLFFPDAGKFILKNRVVSGQHESFGIAKNRRGQPVAARASSDVDEDGIDVFGDKGIVCGRSQPNALKASVALDTFNCGLCSDMDVWNCGDLVDQIAGHGVGEAVLPHDDVNFTRVT